VKRKPGIWKGRTTMEKIAILGAGNGGHAVAADLGRQGYETSIYSRSAATLEALTARGGVAYTGCFGEGFSPIKTITPNIEEAIDGARIIIITVPTIALTWYAHLLAPYLNESHTVMLNPGHTGGGLHFVQTLREAGNAKEVRTCETITLTYGCRIRGPALVWIPLAMTNLRLAAFPGKHLDALFPTIHTLFPNVVPGTNVLETGLTDLNAMEHPPGMLLNAAWIEHTKGNFRFYFDGVSPAVARVIQGMDDERMRILRALNERAGLDMRVMSFIEYFYEAGLTSRAALESGDMYQALQESEPNKPIQAPDSLDHRYVNEDVGFGLVPMVEIGRWVGIECPTTEALVRLACVMMKRDYWHEGLTLAKMGVDQVPVERVGEFLWEGHL